MAETKLKPEQAFNSGAVQIYSQHLTASWASTANANEQVLGTGGTPLLITLPIIKKTCKVKITICGYVTTGAGNNNFRGTVGSTSTGLGNTIGCDIYIGGAISGNNLTLSNTSVTSVDLSTQQYAAATIQNSSSNSVSFSASNWRCGLIVEIYT